MSEAVSQLEPRSLWGHFAGLNAVPRPSKHEERVIQWVVQVAESQGLKAEKDHVDNVLIRKPATPGMEGRATVVLQSHLDMVCQKNNDTDFDFMSEGIRMVVDGDWVRADGTTLGADNGIGVAAILALLTSTDIPHPPLEAFFTIDEETGMTGALGLKGGWLRGEYLLNLDTEDDDELSIGCAGGVDVTSTATYDQEAIQTEGVAAFRVNLRGGSGGHSGMDINKGLANANKLMNRLLLVASEFVDFRLTRVDGGGLRNAIPRESTAELIAMEEDVTLLKATLVDAMKEIGEEYATTDSALNLSVERIELTATHALPESVQDALLLAVQACPVGIHRMSPDIEGLVQTSNNLARVLVDEGEVSIKCLTRSSVDSEKWDQARSIESIMTLAGLETKYSGDYPGWTPNPSSELVDSMKSLYVERYGEQPKVLACHAGLECGILGTNYPDMDMVSFGPNIRGAHSPEECVQISSVDKFWHFLIAALERIPEATKK